MKVYFHIDLDAFFASVEQSDNPGLKGKPVIVGGADSSRGVVSACSYEARVFGVHSAMPIFKARRLCPNGYYLPVRMKRYQQVSRHIMSILEHYSPSIQQISIDEAFLDMSGTQSLLGPPKTAAETIKEDIRKDTGLTSSIGIASNRYIAKMASDRNKPDGICHVPEGSEYDFISTYSLGKLWGIGKKGIQSLHQHNIYTVDQLRTFSMSWLQRVFGESTGSFYYHIVRGDDPGIFTQETKSRSVSNEVTLEQNTSDPDELRPILHQLAHQVMFRLIKNKQIASTIGVKYKLASFKTFTVQCTPDKPIYSAEEVFNYAWSLFLKRWDQESPIRLIGISLNSVTKRLEPLQEELFYDEYKKRREVEKTVLQLRSTGKPIMKASDLFQTKRKDP